MNIDPAKARDAARTGVPLVIRSNLLPASTEADLDEILTIFLEELGLSDVKNYLSYCLRELTGNAKKANTKRAYFQSKGLEIGKADHYATGMANFKNETLTNIEHYLALQEQAGLYIRVSFLVRKAVLVVKVSNNAPMTEVEKQRAFQRIADSRTYTTMEQAFDAVLDDTEGAGLGLTILVLMLRKMGLTEKSFELESNAEETSATLRVPRVGVHLDLVTHLTDELVQAVDSLPPFPENLKQLVKLLERPDVSFGDLATQLSRDPALIADLIRYINNAGRGRKTRVTNLRDAAQLVGLQGIRSMIIPYGAYKLLSKFVSQQKVLWESAERISTLALGMAKHFHFERQDADLAQIGGLLATLGRLVVACLHPKLDKRIHEFCKLKSVSADRFNDLTQIINPAELGARVAEKWDFPQNLVAVLRHQARPEDGPPELYKVACVIHLAVRLVSAEQGEPSPIDAKVLKTLELTNPADLKALHEKLGATLPSPD